MSVFSNRPKGYRAGLILFVLSFVLFLVGFAIPFWATAEYFAHNSARNTYGTVDFDEGLWMYCTSSRKSDANTTDCAALPVRGFAAWFQFVRVSEVLCLSGLIVASLYMFYVVFRPSSAGPPAKILASLIAFSGLLGFVGCMVYLRKLSSRTTDQEELRVIGAEIYVILKDNTLEVAFYLAVVGSILSVVAAVVLAVFNKPLFNYKPLDMPTSYVGGSVLFTTAASVAHGQSQDQNQGHPVIGGHDVKPPQSHCNFPG